MTARKWIKINQNIRVARLNSEDDWYASSVQDVNEREFCIAVPVKESRPLVLSKGDQVKVSFIADMTRYEFTTMTRGRRHDNIPLFVLAMPEDYTRVQLREFVRVPTTLEVKYARLPLEGKEPVFIKTDSLDLSGGGMRILIKSDLAAETRLMIKFAVPLKTGPQDIDVVGRVLRTWVDERTRLRQAAIQFVKISRKQEDLITRFLFNRMSEQRRLR
ncbi:flagellar brake domain-containing protein [Pelotomaculum terephthalicicum JT]|uniref:flagellar brake protein n=1 Tax=Pelotomaculum terephthalicicum TaxID=206393 RepID=UPI0009CB890B|nr:flagellar brake domain-containing protein [Pelotomaculum terephthalicicum]MCG9967963.1 flagellar brake domain-containing protein [Pelotomaculum terephthalicicum JT]OPY63064.1 MAG: Flagellar brake protein YcgR [Pelotomaculum sp. PtaU1.Bin065]